MLEPQTRASLTDLLRPPSGFELAHGVGTTFTLDLTTALMIPLSRGSAPASVEDPLSILDAVRRVADRLDIFAQAGEISMGTPSDLVAFLERSIHPVTTPGRFSESMRPLVISPLVSDEGLTLPQGRIRDETLLVSRLAIAARFVPR